MEGRGILDNPYWPVVKRDVTQYFQELALWDIGLKPFGPDSPTQGQQYILVLVDYATTEAVARELMLLLSWVGIAR